MWEFLHDTDCILVSKLVTSRVTVLQSWQSHSSGILQINLLLEAFHEIKQHFENHLLSMFGSFYVGRVVVENLVDLKSAFEGYSEPSADLVRTAK